MVLFPQIEGEDGVAGLEECLKDDARGSDDVAETDDGVIAVEEVHRALADDGIEMQAAACGLVTPIEEAVCEYAALEVLRER